jgi:hypothetical protein
MSTWPSLRHACQSVLDPDTVLLDQAWQQQAFYYQGYNIRHAGMLSEMASSRPCSPRSTCSLGIEEPRHRTMPSTLTRPSSLRTSHTCEDKPLDHFLAVPRTRNHHRRPGEAPH